MTTTSSSNMIEPIVNRNFDNKLHHQNDPNQHQRVHKHIGQQYQPTPLQISKKFSPPYLKQRCFGCGIYNKEVR